MDPAHYVFASYVSRRVLSAVVGSNLMEFDPTKRVNSWRAAWPTLTKKAALPGFRFNDEAERRLLPVVEQPLKDIIIVMRDTGQRNGRELYRMRVENIDFDAGTITIPNSKTKSGTRSVPISTRVEEILSLRCGGRAHG